MACPDCGYQMTAFDKDCPRCQRYTHSERACPHCGTVNTPDALACKKCRRSFQAQSSPAPASPNLGAEPSPAPLTVQPLRIAPEPAAEAPRSVPSPAPSSSVPASTPPLSAEALACRMCGNTAGQKLTAICRAGSWTTQSRGYAVGMGSDGYGHSILVGGPTASTTHGQTALASMLLPPSRPVFRPSWIASILIPLVGLLASLAAFSSGPVAATVGVLVTCGLWMVALLTEGRAASDGQARHDAACTTWEQAMQVWNRLFYCSRCDHVYDPQAGTAAVPHAMNTLLLPQSGPVRPLYAPPGQDTVVKAASLAFGVAALLLLGIWSLSASQQHEAQAEAGQVAALRGPLDAQFAAALPVVNSAVSAGDQAMSRTVSEDNYTASEKQSQLSRDLEELKSHRDTAQQDLDTLAKPGEFSALQFSAADAGTEIAGMQTSRQAVVDDLQAFSQAQGSNPLAPADAATGKSVPGDGYSITTQAGGGPPPDPASLPH